MYLQIPKFLERLQNDFVMLQLVIDDKTELPVAEQTKSAYNGRTITTFRREMA